MPLGAAGRIQTPNPLSWPNTRAPLELSAHLLSLIGTPVYPRHKETRRVFDLNRGRRWVIVSEQGKSLKMLIRAQLLQDRPVEVQCAHVYVKVSQCVKVFG